MFQWERSCLAHTRSWVQFLTWRAGENPGTNMGLVLFARWAGTLAFLPICLVVRWCRLLVLDYLVCRAGKECILYKLPGIIATTTIKKKEKTETESRPWTNTDKWPNTPGSREVKEVRRWQAFSDRCSLVCSCLSFLGLEGGSTGIEGKGMSCIIPFVLSLGKDGAGLHSITVSLSLCVCHLSLCLSLMPALLSQQGLTF